MTTPRWLPVDVHAAWEKERDDATRAAHRIAREAALWDRTANTLPFDPELAQQYRDLAERERARSQRVQSRAQQIQDYLDGKIGPWW